MPSSFLRRRVLFIALLVVIHCSCSYAATSGEDDVITCTVGADGEEVCEAAYSSDESSSDDGSEDDDDEDEGRKWWVELSGNYCDNNLSKCSKLRKQGECESNPGFMKYACPLECDMCDEFTSSMKKKKRGIQPCMDHNMKCKEWAGMGECEHNPNYMHVQCARSCMRCYEDSTQFGVEQSLPEKDSKDYEATLELIHNTAKYMRDLWSNEEEEEHNNYNYKCKNMDEDCSFWAATGDECEENQDYMQKKCAPACQLCHLLDIRLRCPEVPGNDPVYKPGDLNRLFENIVDNADGKGEYTKYNPKALARPKLKRDGNAANMKGAIDGPWIVLLENFVSDVEADALIAAGAKKGYERSSDVGAENPDGTHEDEVNDGRTSENAWCDEELCHDDPIINPVIERIAEVTLTHKDNHEELQLLRYEPGQFYNQHHDYIEYQQQLPCGVRMLTVFLYLNDVEDGGGTSFPFLDITVQPKKGYALLWPSVLDEDPEKKDRRTEHEALPVLKGIKYGANAWIHSRNYTAAEENDCA